MRFYICVLTLLGFTLSCELQAIEKSQSQTIDRKSKPASPAKSDDQTVRKIEKQKPEIRSLIEQLVLKQGKRNATYWAAFSRLSEFKQRAFPILIEHLDDDRKSIAFRNHIAGDSVGDACYWIIYSQLQDRPKDYSEYGYQRTGRDGKEHPKPYWEGSPYQAAGGMEKWLQKNRELSYEELQLKCLRWLLRKEMEIGVADSESYFLNILPLEVRILERRLDIGEDVEQELEKMRKIRDEKIIDFIPKELLPER